VVNLQALSEELKLRVLDVVARYRELGCVDIPVSASKVEGGRARGYRVRGRDGAESSCVVKLVWAVHSAPARHRAARRGYLVSFGLRRPGEGRPAAACAVPRRLPRRSRPWQTELWLLSHPVTATTTALPPCLHLHLQISLMPQSAEPKTLGDYFPALKLGGKKR